jgi:hypothetical protein
MSASKATRQKLPMMQLPSGRWTPDMRGLKFGILTVVEKAPSRARKQGPISYWYCKCECGTVKAIGANNLRSGNTKSCGCQNHPFKVRNPEQFDHHHPLYYTHQHIRRRCYEVGNRNYHQYGGRGITVCDRWLNGDGVRSGGQCFADDMGPKPSPKHSIDRIDNDGNYEPGNCRWATPAEQGVNTRVVADHKEIMRLARSGMKVSEIAATVGVHQETVKKWIRRELGVSSTRNALQALAGGGGE